MSDSPIKFVQVRCPNCNAVMNLEDYRSTAFCSYCGTRLLVHRDNEQIYRTVDEAEIIKAEAARDVSLKKAEIEREIELKKLEEKAERSRRIPKIIKFVVIGYLSIMLFMALLFAGSCIAIDFTF